MTRRLICRLFGHREHATPIRRGKVSAIVTGCTRCDRVLSIEDTSRIPRMVVPRNH